MNSRELSRWQSNIRSEGACLMWQGRHTNGYPVFYIRNSYHQAQKVAVGKI